jgi:hypothetical protein
MSQFNPYDPAEQTLAELVRADWGMPLPALDAASRFGPLLSRRPSELSRKELAHAIARGLCLPPLVRRLIDVVEAEPLASAGWFPGDLLRSLIEIPEWFWRQEPELFARYRRALRAAASARRELPPDERLDFWRPIPDPES